MKKEDLFVKNEEGMYPCKHCLRKSKKQVYPRIDNVEGLYYARCNKCRYYDLFDFLGITKKKAIEVWNRTMLGKGVVDE